MVVNNQQSGPLHSTAIILVRPRYPENIGAAARIAHNFSIPKLIVICDEMPDQERMLKMATHKAAHLIKGMETFNDTRLAVASFDFLVGTTARHGKQRLREQTPRQVFNEVAPLVSSHTVGLLFGQESSGLTNYDLDFCQYTSTIPTADFSSLNLAQAVAIHCYELYTAVATIKNRRPVTGEYANSYEIQGMYDHIEQVLTTITFLKDQKHSYWMRNIRQFLGRVRITKKEASIIRGICRKFIWYNENRKEYIRETEEFSPECKS